MKKGRTDSLLENCRALDLTDEKGFLCGKILGDLGADVIKIEMPGGDPSRSIAPFYKDIPDPEKSLYWFAYNNNKRGITLNIETMTGKDIFKRLVKTADFVIESFPVGYLDSTGLGYPVLSALNPRIILSSISPFGQTGPYSKYKASDIEIMAMGGLTYLLGDPDRPPVRVSVPQSYMWAGAYAALGTLIAHYHRESTGEGQVVDVSMQASLLWAGLQAPVIWEINREIMRREGNAITKRSVKGAVFPSAYRCKDGYVAFPLYHGPAGAITNRAITEWMDSEGFATEYLKQKDWDKFSITQATQEELDQIIKPVSKFLATKAKKEFHEEAIKRRIMGYPVSTVEDIRQDPQLESRGFWQQVEHPELNNSIIYPGAFAKLSETSVGIWRRAPLIGEHNKEIYQEDLSLSDEELVMLNEANII